jgi:hypothetical protein
VIARWNAPPARSSQNQIHAAKPKTVWRCTECVRIDGNNSTGRRHIGASRLAPAAQAWPQNGLATVEAV